ncbi:MAG: sulfurtransferase TusA family protein [Clostridiales bacterium]|nr:sulfurtransferase TusA family protein [Clostridiales bacterium]
MRKTIDACGLSCPEPVLLLKQDIDDAEEIELHVDNQASVNNCCRFARSKGFCVSVGGGGGKYTLTLTKG